MGDDQAEFNKTVLPLTGRGYEEDFFKVKELNEDEGVEDFKNIKNIQIKTDLSRLAFFNDNGTQR
jgi:hypothetical protein